MTARNLTVQTFVTAALPRAALLNRRPVAQATLFHNPDLAGMVPQASAFQLLLLLWFFPFGCAKAARLMAGFLNRLQRFSG